MEELKPVAMEGETAFIVVKREDGTFFAYSDFDLELSIKRSANHLDIKIGCNEILDLLKMDELARLLTNILSPAPESERTASSIRQALSDKGIL